MLLPCGKSSHLEAGYANGSGKKLYILGDFVKGEFDVMYGFADKLVRDVREFKDLLPTPPEEVTTKENFHELPKFKGQNKEY